MRAEKGKKQKTKTANFEKLEESLEKDWN